MIEHEYSKEKVNAALKSSPSMPAASTNALPKSPFSESGEETSPRSQSTATKGSPTKSSLEWLQAKREYWKSSQRRKLVEYPSDEGNDFEKAQQALKLLSAIQTGKADASALLSGIDTISKRQDKDTESPETVAMKNPNRDRLVAFYEKYNPSKLSTVDETLQKYRGQEDELFRKLEAKYADDPYLPATGTGPHCFMEFSTGGSVTFELFQDKAPFAAENFRSLCTGDKGASYRNCRVHRIVPNFCIQAGDYTKGDGTGGRSIYPKASPANPKTDMWGNFEDETPFLRHDSAGLLSMANNGPNRNSSQFFITLRPLPHLNGKHVVFGRVTQGMDVVELLSRLETNAKTQRPVEPLHIVNCGELGNEVDTNTVLPDVSHASNTAPPAVFPGFSFSPPVTNGSHFNTLPSTTPVDLGETGSRFIQEETKEKNSRINIFQEIASIKDNTKLEQRPMDELVPSSNRDHELCVQINSCLQFLDSHGASDSQFSSQSMARGMEESYVQSTRVGGVTSRETLSSNSELSNSQDNHRPRRTIATFLLEDPIGLAIMDMVKGKEKALMKSVPPLHRGAIELKCVSRSSTKKLNAPLVMSEGYRLSNQYHLECDPLFVSFATLTRQTPT